VIHAPPSEVLGMEDRMREGVLRAARKLWEVQLAAAGMRALRR
jgi:hypothetical protein